MRASQSDLEAQFALLIDIRDRISETHEAITTLRAIRRQVEQWVERAQGHQAREEVTQLAGALKEKLAEIEEQLIQVKARARHDTLNHPAMLNAKLVALAAVVSSADASPTRQSYELFQDLTSQLQQLQARLQTCIDAELATFNTFIHESGLAAVIPPASTKKQPEFES